MGLTPGPVQPQLLSLSFRAGSCNYGSPQTLEPVLHNERGQSTARREKPPLGAPAELQTQGASAAGPSLRGKTTVEGFWPAAPGEQVQARRGTAVAGAAAKPGCNTAPP